MLWRTLMMTNIDIYKIESIYKEIEYDMLDNNSQAYHLILHIINNKLTPTEKRIFLLYVELASCRKVAKHTDIKYRQIAYILNKIRGKIIKEINNYGNNYDD